MRSITPFLQKDLFKKMVFVSGPRQVGKTTLAKEILKNSQSGLYLNWDEASLKKSILEAHWADNQKLIVLDEIHKYPKWKNWIKGVFDTQREQHQFLVTGSARLDVYRRGADSLLGRYHHWRLHPFDLSEIPQKISPKEAFDRLLKFGGFPEPFLDGDEREARRWRLERNRKVLGEDLRDLKEIRQIQMIPVLLDLLKSRVGGAVVFSNLAADLQVSPITVKDWVQLLESTYLIFQVVPFTKQLPRAIQKPPKIYFYDNADVDGDEGAIFENLVATHLLKALHFAEDYAGHRYELRYIRDKEKREVDFVILKDRKPIELIEVKLRDTKPSPHLIYFGEKLKIPKLTQIVATPNVNWTQGRLRVVSAVDELRQLNRFW
jgi:predicted AAA+ superfamily ATPase